MKSSLRRVGFGVILWGVPYVAAIPMLALNKSDPLTFKAMEVSIASLTMAVLLIAYFSKVSGRYLREAVLLAVTLVVVNWLLDFVGLLPFTHQTLPQYFSQIGIEYAASGLLVVAFGYVLEKKTGQKR